MNDSHNTYQKSLEMRWQDNFKLLKEYISEHGKLPLQKTAYKGVNLGLWVNTQKVAFKKGSLLPEREELLRSAGLSFEDLGDTFERQWLTYFELLKQYVAEFGYMPKAVAEYHGMKLGIWLANQKNASRCGLLPQNRAEMLRDFGVPLEGIREQQWQKVFEVFKDFISDNGKVPSRTAIHKGVRIGAWLGNQRTMFKKGALSPEREKLLRSVGVTFENKQVAFDRQWKNNFALLKEYVARFGKVPTMQIMYKGVNLGNWANNQKMEFKRGKLSPGKEKLLREVGIPLEGTHKHRWCECFSLLQEYVAENGKLPAKRATYKEVRLGGWLDNQKTAFRNGVLAPEREVLLRDVGVKFVAPKSKS